MANATSRFGTLVDYLLTASLLCGLRPSGPPAYRLQLFFVANRDLGSRHHQSDFQRAIETGVDAHGLWDNFMGRGGGEYTITERGWLAAQQLGRVNAPKYPPVRASEFACRIHGTLGDTRLEIVTRGKKSRVLLNGEQMPSAKEACRRLERSTGTPLPTEGDNAVRVLYNLAVDRGLSLVWEGAEIEISTTAPSA